MSWPFPDLGAKADGAHVCLMKPTLSEVEGADVGDRACDVVCMLMNCM